jgi:RNA polymerase sigma factor (sigma-70 family)
VPAKVCAPCNFQKFQLFAKSADRKAFKPNSELRAGERGFLKSSPENQPMDRRILAQERSLPATFANDQELLHACRQGDERAWQQLLTQYERLVFSIPRSYGLASEDAADIVQIVFSALLKQLPTLRDDSNLGGWLAQVARRQTWRLLKRRKIEPVEALDQESVAQLLPTTTGEIERWELAEWLHRGLNRLGGRCQELLTALYFDGEEPSYAEIARRLQIAEGSIGPTRARCLQRLREVLGDSGSG